MICLIILVKIILMVDHALFRKKKKRTLRLAELLMKYRKIFKILKKYEFCNFTTQCESKP